MEPLLKRTLIFIHGAGGSSQVWNNQLSSLRDYQLISIDLPGHGASVEAPLTSIEDYSQSIYKFIGRNRDPRKSILIGHSMGGAIAMDFAIAHPELVEGLVLVATGAKLKVNPAFLDTLSQGKHPFELVPFLYSSSAPQMFLDESIEEMKKVPAEVYLADFLACDAFNCTNKIHSLQIPTLILCGEEDRMTPIKYSQYLHQSIIGSRLEIIPHSGHMCMLEKPIQVTLAIEQFCRTLPAKA